VVKGELDRPVSLSMKLMELLMEVIRLVPFSHLSSAEGGDEADEIVRVSRVS